MISSLFMGIISAEKILHSGMCEKHPYHPGRECRQLRHGLIVVQGSSHRLSGLRCPAGSELSFFHPHLAISTFHDFVKMGRITPMKGIRGFYLLNPSRSRLGCCRWRSWISAEADELAAIYHNRDEIRRLMWDYVSIAHRQPPSPCFRDTNDFE